MTALLDITAVRDICHRACRLLADEPALNAIPYRAEAVQQLVFTVGAEVGGRDIRRQIAGYDDKGQIIHGPALSWWQIETDTANDCDMSWLRYRPTIRDAIYRHLSPGMSLVDGVYDDPLIAAMIARVVYRRRRGKFVAVDDYAGQAALWKAAYNTPAGKGTVWEAMERYRAWTGAE